MTHNARRFSPPKATFWNDEVLKNPEGVYLKILEILEGTPS